MTHRDTNRPNDRERLAKLWMLGKVWVGWQQTHDYTIIWLLRQMVLELVGKGQVPKKSVGANCAVVARSGGTLAGQKWHGECLRGGG